MRRMAGFPRPEQRRWTAWRATFAVVGAAMSILLSVGGAGAVDSSLFKQKSDKNEPIVFQADEVEYDDKLALTVAEGHVEISQSCQVPVDDTGTYRQKTDTGSASRSTRLL